MSDAGGEVWGTVEVLPRSFMEQAAFGGCADDAESELEHSAPLILPNRLGIFDRTGMETAGAHGEDCRAAGRQSAGKGPGERLQHMRRPAGIRRNVPPEWEGVDFPRQRGRLP